MRHLRSGRFRKEVMITDETTRQTEPSVPCRVSGVAIERVSGGVRLLRGDDLELVSRLSELPQPPWPAAATSSRCRRGHPCNQANQCQGARSGGGETSSTS